MPNLCSKTLILEIRLSSLLYICIMTLICFTVWPLMRAQQELHISQFIVIYCIPWTFHTLKHHHFFSNTMYFYPHPEPEVSNFNLYYKLSSDRLLYINFFRESACLKCKKRNSWDIFFINIKLVVLMHNYIISPVLLERICKGSVKSVNNKLLVSISSLLFFVVICMSFNFFTCCILFKFVHFCMLYVNIHCWLPPPPNFLLPVLLWPYAVST